MSTPPLVSVIIPAFNAANSLAMALDSAMAQSVPLEVIVIDDGSTDQTLVTARSYGETITLVEQPNQGQGAARNAGLSIASGEYVAFLDADDYWASSFLERCLEFLREHPECIAVSTAIIVKDVDGNESTLPDAVRGPNAIVRPIVLDDFFGFWAAQNHLRTGSVMIRKSVIDEAGFQRADLRVSQDLEYWAYLGTFGTWGFIPEPLWVGNSRAAGSGAWRSKYRERRRLCPTVESWEERIVSRLTSDQCAAFRMIRGRVAAGYAYNKILGGASSEAREIIGRYAREMPQDRVTGLMRLGDRFGAAGWKVICGIVQVREMLKSLMFWIHPRVRR